MSDQSNLSIHCSRTRVWASMHFCCVCAHLENSMSFELCLFLGDHKCFMVRYINDAALKRPNLSPVPAFFEKYQGYNDFIRKKCKSQPLDQTQLNSHSHAIFSILNRVVFKRNKNWIDFGKLLESLAFCFSQYRDYLNTQLN